MSDYSIPIFPYQIQWPAANGSDYFAGLWTHQAIELSIFYRPDNEAPIPVKALAILMPDLPMTILPDRYKMFLGEIFIPADEFPNHWPENWGRPAFRSEGGRFASESIRAEFFDSDQEQKVILYLHDVVVVNDPTGKMPIILGGDFLGMENLDQANILLTPGKLRPTGTLYPISQTGIEMIHHHRWIDPEFAWGSFRFKAGL